jgi:integrase
LYCTLRISEVLGVQWKHVDFRRGVILVSQRFYRGDVDVVKSERSQRDVPMGLLAADLANSVSRTGTWRRVRVWRPDACCTGKEGPGLPG